MEPLKFHPQLRETLWGGERIGTFKRGVETSSDRIGESWEISGLRGCESIVAGGTFDGQSLREVIRQEGANLVGRANWSRFGEEFPLLIKFIDARLDLSVQVHPNDQIARERHNAMGKSEMWYVVDALPESRLISGFSRQLTPEKYEEALRKKRIADSLQHHTVQAGDLFYLPAGRVHSIGAGCFIAEIQQSSDITYRVYDFDRRDKDGNLRELHTEWAREALDFRVEEDYRTHYPRQINRPTPLVDTPAFTVDLYHLTEPHEVDLRPLDSFVALLFVEGHGVVTTAEGTEISVEQGESLLLPATCAGLTISPTTPGLKLLASYIR